MVAWTIWTQQTIWMLPRMLPPRLLRPAPSDTSRQVLMFGVAGLTALIAVSVRAGRGR